MELDHLKGLSSLMMSTKVCSLSCWMGPALCTEEHEGWRLLSSNFQCRCALSEANFKRNESIIGLEGTLQSDLRKVKDICGNTDLLSG